ncbi:SDR family NAD(P)-dependent oxidoreductase [Cocleimonas sp. KMM 6892]|uniref:SDR family NAD(P)-dependent oxidoreductase n=1 Tax=unclassified Cocleimonas TaxID=2639732 RepID=UPI002DBE9FFF|nr:MULTISPECIES: SDR family NAD(P)-dependent oxidoreductase [unclassified Cocleimonas]MEB8431556.1 SDR family NAD(P)-dependent oxidoreductase [Cocleimonas sp. KMM 6892]MEC4713672.1 SDR family NAD(P)-dependent oxidoreductase [Cocleimonas sp. KMM 6895]MEC4743003.1 SDR family NAD(P)-dependent oxidoreductase [Cocleimonas sp. KMM 6896]
MKEPTNFLIAGATGGIGHAICEALAIRYPDVTLIRMARNLEKLTALSCNTIDIQFDLASENSLLQAIEQIPADINIDWAFIASGWLHDEHTQPEKTYRSLSAEQLAQSFSLNAIGPSLLVKYLLEKNDKKHPLKIGVLSARVGSISDNRLGGWHSYRASKAALNMLIKNYAIELTRMKRPVVIVGLQPGTTDTLLSAPFQQGVPEGHLQMPEFTASKLIDVVDNLKPDDSGYLFDFLGEKFEP